MSDKRLTIRTNTLESYLSLPLEQRERKVWWWPFGPWYIVPYAMVWDSLTGSEWKKFDKYCREHYPVQRWLRDDLLYFCKYTIGKNLKELKWAIKHRIRNPRKEFRDSVFPPRYHDLDYHIVQFHAQCIIEYIEREKGHITPTSESDLDSIKKAKELDELYEYCKVGREKLANAADEALMNAPTKGTYEERYGKTDALEKQLEESDTKLCKWVIDNRNYLWT